MGTVDMMTPAMGMKPQMKTKTERSTMPGMLRSHMPSMVSMVFMAAMRACMGWGGVGWVRVRVRVWAWAWAWVWV
jgi:hypothetical protein